MDDSNFKPETRHVNNKVSKVLTNNHEKVPEKTWDVSSEGVIPSDNLNITVKPQVSRPKREAANLANLKLKEIFSQEF